MGVIEQYRMLYNEHVADKAKLLIIRYNTQKHKYEYQPYSHTVSDKALDDLSDLIISNLIFYAFSEDEIIDLHTNFGILDDLRNAAKYAYIQRLPKRKNADTDGTVGEVLLDILIQVFEPSSQKLIARAKYKQQGDNNEIKGYDALYFTKSKDEISLWLGQVKTGAYSYCKTSIVSDLNEKYILDYFCKSMFYVADKAEKSSDLSTILNSINKICYNSITHKWSDSEKKQALIKLLEEEGIKLRIPCLLSYTADIYYDENELNKNIENCVMQIVNEFDKTDFQIANELEYELLFCVFPLKDVKELRSKIIEFKKEGY